MTTETPQQSVLSPSSKDLHWGRGARGFGLFLLGAWLLVLGGALLVGERETSLQQLQSDVSSGRTEEVRVVGAMRADSLGSAVVELHWSAGVRRHVTEVVEARPIAEGKSGGFFDEKAPVVAPGTAERLVQEQPGLRLVRQETSSGYHSLLGQRVPGVLGIVVFALAVTTFGLLICGPQPWRATRWAWVWIVGMAPPVALVAYLLVGGPTGLAPPRPAARRLTGGWAFLLAVVVASTTALG